MSERPTPRTDAKEITQTFASLPPCKTGRVPADFARQLERELAEAREESLEQARLLGRSGEREAKLLSELAEARESLDFQIKLNREIIDREARLLAELAEAKEQRDRLANACRMLVAIIGPPDNKDWATDDEVDAAYTAGVDALDCID